MSPLALAIVKEAPRTADVLLHNGAQPCDWANSKGTALQLATFKAALGSRAAQKILVRMLTIAPELAPETLKEAVVTGNPKFVESVLSIMSKSSTSPDMPLERLYDLVLTFKSSKKQEIPRLKLLSIIDMLHAWDTVRRLPFVQAQSVEWAIEHDKYSCLEKLLSLRVVDPASLPEILQWCVATGQDLKWQYLLNFYGTQNVTAPAQARDTGRVIELPSHTERPLELPSTVT